MAYTTNISTNLSTNQPLKEAFKEWKSVNFFYTPCDIFMFFYGYPLWMAIAQPPEVQLTQVLFLQLEDSQLMIWGTGSASKVHSKPDL